MMFHRTRREGDHHPHNHWGKPTNLFLNTKLLGVIIYHKLNWSNHILYIKNKISKSIDIINKKRKILDKNMLRNIYLVEYTP